ncbi:MAG: hypothetical protein WAQ98_30050 [Blastocatellia bacterium]
MNLIKFPLSNTKGKEISLPNNLTLTNETENAITSLAYQDWEIEEIIENFSETEQDMLIEKISDQVQEWELTLDANLELWLRTKHKESKGNISYIDFLYDLAQEQVYRAYAIEKLNEQKNKAPLVGSNNSVNDKSVSFSTSNNQTATTTAATPTDVLATQTANNLNYLLDDEEQQINRVIDGLSEAEQDLLIEKTVLLFDQWVSTTDVGLDLALKMQHQKSQPNIPYQNFLYELAQSQVYREYAVEQLELAKQNNFGLIESFTEIEKVHCDKANSVDELTFDEPIFDNASQDTNNVGVQLLEANNYTIINDEITSSSNSAIFIREESFSNKISLDHYQVSVGDDQGHQEILTSLKDCANHHIIKTSPNSYRKLTTKYINQQSSNISSSSYLWKNSLLIKPKQALLITIYFGKDISSLHPLSLPP